VLAEFTATEFPFLIGRIRTVSISKFVTPNVSLFPFLIGRIRTGIGIGNYT